MLELIQTTITYILPSLLTLIGTIVVAVLAYKQGAAKDRTELKQNLTNHLDEKLERIWDDIREDATRYRDQVIDGDEKNSLLLIELIETKKKLTEATLENMSLNADRINYKKKIDNMAIKIKSLEKRLSIYEKNIK